MKTHLDSNKNQELCFWSQFSYEIKTIPEKIQKGYEASREAVRLFFSAPPHEKMNQLATLTFLGAVSGMTVYCFSKLHQIAKNNLPAYAYYSFCAGIAVAISIANERMKKPDLSQANEAKKNSSIRSCECSLKGRQIERLNS